MTSTPDGDVSWDSDLSSNLIAICYINWDDLFRSSLFIIL